MGREQTVKFNSNSMQLDTSVFTDFSAQVSETPSHPGLNILLCLIVTVLDLVSHFDPSAVACIYFNLFLLTSVKGQVVVTWYNTRAVIRGSDT